ncbi:hypothetical protein [Sphingomonas sp. Leaf4]|uniref:hypothetical protein n=1 Tax=Sphingomonas sp. Leaf4 TaxID=2876553 RepID=UPI001E30F321|nr:hypothetical protein [Sphingomonas sp. Leaf4]
MTVARLSIALMATALTIVPATAQWRDGQPPMAGNATTRSGQPLTLPAPPAAADPARIELARFAAAYAAAGRPRVVVFWNRELTADLDSGREEVTRLHVDGEQRAEGSRSETAWRRGTDTEVTANGSSRIDAEQVTTTRTLDPGRRAAADDEARDFDIERGFSDALADAGVRLIDRTAILRTTALGNDTANVQSIETRALLGRAEWTLEVVAMNDGRRRIVGRDLASGQVVVRAVSAGRPPVGSQPYVAGERGFVRASVAAPGPYAVGRQIALDAMRAIARR